MRESRWWRWAGLAAIGALAALFATFNSGERVALSLGFTELYRVPLVVLIFVAFLAGMITMFLLGLRHDLRVRRALREAGFGEPIAAEEFASRWGDEGTEDTTPLPQPPAEYPRQEAHRPAFLPPEPVQPDVPPDINPPSR